MVGTRRGANFTAAELDCFLDIVGDVLPLSATHWDNVAATHLSRYPDTGRNVGSLKRKFKELHGKRISTGDPNCPPAVCTAKRLKQSIIELMNGTDLQSGEEEEDDDGVSVPALPGIGGEAEDGDDTNLFADDGEHPDDEAANAGAALLNEVPAAVNRPSSRAGSSVSGVSGGRGVSRSRHPRAGTHLTPMGRSRTSRARESSPDEGPND